MRKAAIILFFISSFLFLSEYTESKPKLLEPNAALGRTTKVVADQIIIRFKDQVNDPEMVVRLLKDLNIQLEDQLLKQEQSLNPAYNNSKNNNLQAAGNFEKILKAEKPLLRTYIVSYPGKMPPEKFSKMVLNQHPEIEIAEPVTVDEMLGNYVPNDPRISQQEVLKQIQAFQAWSYFQGDTSVIIGISDNGVFQNHEDLRGNIAPNWKEIPDNGIDDDKNGFIDDFNGVNLAFYDDGKNPGNTYNTSESHGTSVASIAGASTDNATGMSGVGFKCRIFPIKAAPYDDTSILYGYKSLIYAAIRGCKVINCSWGSVKRYSAVDQSIIDYAVARGVSVVAAGGNGKNSTSIYYPAGYKGVLGVGEINASAEVTYNTSIGSAVRLMAEGEDNVGATNGNGYEVLSGGGTSFAAPVVSGVVAMVRAKYPQLDPIQAIEYTRQCSDPVDVGTDPEMKFFIPGKVNLLKAISEDQITIPAVRPLELVSLNLKETTKGRFGINDTVKLMIKAHNYLAPAANLIFVLSTYSSSNERIKLIDSSVTLNLVNGSSDFNIDRFSFIQKDIDTDPVFLRVDIYGANDYHDFFIAEYFNATDATTLSNKSLQFSVGDRGSFGFGLAAYNSQGVGFRLTNGYSQLYKGCLMATESNSKSVSGVFSNSFSDVSDFNAIKTFTGSDYNIGIIDDSRAISSDKIGLKIQLDYSFPGDLIPVTKVNVKATNISGKSLNNVAIGYYLDWDIGFDTDSNKTSLFPEAYPEFFSPVAIVAEVAESIYPDFPVFAALAYSPDANNQAQAAAMNYSIIEDFTQKEKVDALNSGTDIQMNENADINMTVGMRFPGEFKAGDTRSFVMLIGAGKTKDQLSSDMKSSLLGTGVPEISSEALMRIYPNPAEDLIFIEILNGFNPQRFKIINVLGEIQKSGEFESPNSGLYSINLSGNIVGKGLYFIELSNGKQKMVGKIIIK